MSTESLQFKTRFKDATGRGASVVWSAVIKNVPDKTENRFAVVDVLDIEGELDLGWFEVFTLSYENHTSDRLEDWVARKLEAFIEEGSGVSEFQGFHAIDTVKQNVK